MGILGKVVLDSLPFFQYNKRDVFSAGQRCHAFVAYNIRKGGGFRYEDDISAEKETEIQSSWIQKENEHCQWQKGIIQKKSKR